MSWIHAARTRARLLFGARAAEDRMNEEISFHVDMEAERLQREEGLDPVEARRRARVAFGGLEAHKEAMREGRGLAWLGGLNLDFRLGLRMLVKYPGLTVIGGLAMAFAIWAGTITFVMGSLLLDPTLPLPDGDRVVRIENWDLSARDEDDRALSDFAVWRTGLRSVTDLGAYRDVSRNLLVGGDIGSPVNVAEITASAFRIAPERPLLGRVLTAADERPGSPPVVLLGYEVWRTRFAGDPTVVGRSVRLGDAYPTVVGVMPEGFAFPVAHELWTPLRLDPAAFGPLEGPSIKVFGRLAPGVTLEGAQAELTTLGRRAAAEHPDTHGRLQPRVQPYAGELFSASGDGFFMLLIELFAVMLLVLICSNVALLLFARAATRETELVVRSALGASRARIVAQLFAEALVLGGVSAAVGLAAAHLALRQWGLPFLKMNMGTVPFWYDPHLTLETILYACGLTLLGAAIAGVLPGLKITRGIGARLKAGTGGGGGPQFGGVWTAVIVAQVAVTVAFPAVVLVEVQELRRIRSYDFGFAAEQYLTAQLAVDDVAGADAGLDSAATAAARARFGSVLEALRQGVAAEPGVRGVTFVDRLPSDNYGDHRIEMDDAPPASVPAAGADAAPAPMRWASMATVDPSYFDVLEAPILAGRGFQPADLAPGARVVIVDQGFVDGVLMGRNPIGRRVRIVPWSSPDSVPRPGPWHQIVGVVKELGMSGAAEQGREAGLYLPGAPGRDFAPFMVVHAQGDPLSLAPRLRGIAGGVDATLRLSAVQRMDQLTGPLVWVLGLWLRMTLVVTGLALLLSLAGIYAVLSFTVVRRTREIGVRVALGANPRRVLAATFRRPLAQVGLGVLTGATVIGLGAVAMFRTTQFRDAGHEFSLAQVGLLAGYAAFMLGVCLLACVVPTWRVLRVQPMEALRAE